MRKCVSGKYMEDLSSVINVTNAQVSLERSNSIHILTFERNEGVDRV